MTLPILTVPRTLDPSLSVLASCGFRQGSRSRHGLRFPLLLSQLRIFLGFEIACISWTIARNFHYYGVIVSLCKMIVAAGFRIHAAGWKRLQRPLIEMSAVPEVPLAGYYSGYPVVAVGVRLDRGVRGHKQENRVEARF